MKLIKNRLVWLVLIIGTLTNCNNDEGISVPLQNEVNEFVWFGMRDYYYWQAEVEDLSTAKYPTYNDLYDFLNGYPGPESLFDDLLHPDDRFSWLVDDYESLEQSFQGITKSFGYDIGLARIESGSDDLLAYIRYIVPGGPAEDAGLVRGDIFTTVDGQQLTIGNYISLLFESESIKISLSEVVENTITPTNQELSITAEQLIENPNFLSKVLEIEGQKIGYFVYNQFVNSNAYHEEMNNIFGTFKNDGISDLVLDFRYNGGGSLNTARILSSMVYGNATSSDLVGSIIYNNNLSDFNTDLSFLTEVPVFDSNGIQTSTLPMNRLNINRVYILTSGSSASASEFVIAGLLPYMNVTLIGTTTVGKNVASITVYDSDDYQKSASLNQNHTYAMQPIISQLANSQGFTDYVDGLEPNIEVNEISFLGNLKPLGDPSEALLSEALAVISGAARKSQPLVNGMESIKDFRMNSLVNTTLLENNVLPQIIRSQILEGFE